MANQLLTRFSDWITLNRRNTKIYKDRSWLRYIISGSFIRPQEFRKNQALADIETKISVMRDLANDSQISTALSYYATDATTTNSSGQIIWATSEDKGCADIINDLFKIMKINSYVRDHILELATVGNLYIPTTDMYREFAGSARYGVGLDGNTIPDDAFEIVPSYKVTPENVMHLWLRGKPYGYLYRGDDNSSDTIVFPETAMIHFSLGGLLGDYTIDLQDTSGALTEFDVQFAEPLMMNALKPTQSLSMLEDATLLAALIRVVKFVNVDCSGAERDEIQNLLQQVKDAIENQMSLNTLTGDTQSFINPQSPNNLIYLPKVNGNDAISITDLNMAENTESDIKLLDYYQNKKLSVLGIPKEAMNFTSNEGLGAAGNVMSQRSALYANILDRLMTAYKNGWTDALNMLFRARGYSGFVDKFELHMNPIITTQSTIQFDKRDSALSQATQLVDLLKGLGISDNKDYAIALIEALGEVFPSVGSNISNWKMQLEGDVGDAI